MARADSITSSVEYDVSFAAPGSATQTVTNPIVGSSTSAFLTVPDSYSSALDAQQAFSGSGAKGTVTAGAFFVNGSARNTLTATNIVELEATIAGSYSFNFHITGGVLHLGDFARPSFAVDIPIASFLAQVEVISGGSTTLSYFTSATYTLDGLGGQTLTVVGPDISASDFADSAGFGDYNVVGKLIPDFSPTVDLGLLAAGDIVRYTLIAQGSGRGNETGFFAQVNDPNDLSNGSIAGASLSLTGGGEPDPVPEPATALLFAAGGAALWVLRRRR